MALLYDPFYPLYVPFVSQPIWELHEIYIWQIVLSNLGKTKTFISLQYRYEKNHREGPALSFLVTVFAISYIILILMKWIESQTINAINRTQTNGMNAGNDGNANNPIDANSDKQQTTTGNAQEKENQNQTSEDGKDSKQTSKDGKDCNQTSEDEKDCNQTSEDCKDSNETSEQSNTCSPKNKIHSS